MLSLLPAMLCWNAPTTPRQTTRPVSYTHLDVYKRQEQQRSEKIDRFLTHKYLGIPIFLLIMMTIFWLTFAFIGAPLQDLLSAWIDRFTAMLSNILIAADVTPWLHSLIINGVCAGVGSVLSFLPIIVLLFFFLSLLEDSGYMARVAFVMDKLLRKIGLSGRSFVPMLIGFGCSVPAIMATRTLSSDRDRKMTIVLTPFMSCSAKLPIYGMITAAFFPNHAALVMVSLYVLGIVVAILSGLLLKNTIFPVSYTHLDVYKRQGVRVRCNKWFMVFFTDADNIPETAIRQMGNVHDNTHTVHSIDHFHTKWFESQSHLLRIKRVWITQAVFFIPCNGNQTDAHFIHFF